MLEGDFALKAMTGDDMQVEDSFHMRIVIPPDAPKTLPTVEELGGRIERKLDNHVTNPGLLCLGSPLNLLVIMGEEPTFNTFIEGCLVPYLFATSLRLQGRSDFVFGELKHGNEGLLQDYKSIFGVTSDRAAIQCLVLLGKRRRVANKLSCPCGCQKRFGRCSLHRRINKLRALSPRSWFRLEALRFTRA